MTDLSYDEQRAFLHLPEVRHLVVADRARTRQRRMLRRLQSALDWVGSERVGVN